ncbi:MAG: hypothetical protein PHU25_04110 [Deltaproteobacteria bacterium]|nr:hypothetical protein [Deltaproteobacteria bacterium]
MAGDLDVGAWLARLGGRLVALVEWRQRSVRFAQAVVELEPGDAAGAMERVFVEAFCDRGREPRAIAESALIAVADRIWPREHRTATQEAARELDRRLVALFLSDPREIAPDETISFPVPDYGEGRMLTLGERRALATMPSRRMLDRVIRDPHPMVTVKLLANPKLKESDVVRMAARRPAPAEILLEIAMHPRWRRMRRVALALIHNPYLPPRTAVTLLPALDAREAAEVAADNAIDGVVREGARLLLAAAEKIRKPKGRSGR